MVRVPNIFGTQHDAHGPGNRSMIPMWHRDDAKPGLPRQSQGYRDEGGNQGSRFRFPWCQRGRETLLGSPPEASGPKRGEKEQSGARRRESASWLHPTPPCGVPSADTKGHRVRGEQRGSDAAMHRLGWRCRAAKLRAEPAAPRGPDLSGTRRPAGSDADGQSASSARKTVSRWRAPGALAIG